MSIADVNLPPKPDIPGDDAKPQDMMAYQEKMYNYQFALQTHQSVLTQEESTRTNMAKSQHDALMSVVQNMKS